MPGHFVTRNKQNSHYFKHSYRVGGGGKRESQTTVMKDSSKQSLKSAQSTTIVKFDDSYKPNYNNDVYQLVTETWPSKANHKSNTDNNNNHYVKNSNNKLEHANTPQLTALVSFPGSGNTWLRYLLQQATGK